MDVSKVKPTYVSLRVANNGIDDSTNPSTVIYDASDSADSYINASIKQGLNSSIFPIASNYICAVERLELSIDAVPFYLAENESITVYNKANMAQTSSVLMNENAYSISQLFSILNKQLYTDPSNATTFTCTFSLTKDGFVSFELGGGKSFANLLFRFPRKLNLILGFSDSRQTTGSAAYSSIPRLDMGDNLQHIVLESNLNSISDQIGTVSLNVLTDFAPPSQYSNSLSYAASNALQQSGFSTNLRQKVIYTPTERRYLDLISSFAIQSINIDAYYTDIDNNIRRVELGLGGVFEIKIGFYKKE